MIPALLPLHYKSRLRLVKKRLRYIRRDRIILTAHHIHNAEVARVRYIRRGSIERIETGKPELRGPVLGCGKGKRVVEEFLGWEVGEVVVPWSEALVGGGRMVEVG